MIAHFIIGFLTGVVVLAVVCVIIAEGRKK